MSALTNRADDRSKSILEEAPEDDPALANCIVEHIGDIGVFRAQFDQLPHQLISFIHSQLVSGGNYGMDTIITIVADIWLNINFGAIVVGNADADISLFHVFPSFLIFPWNNCSIT